MTRRGLLNVANLITVEQVEEELLDLQVSTILRSVKTN